MRRSIVAFSFLVLGVVTTFGPAPSSAQVGSSRPEYDIVYPDNRIVDFKIIIKPQDWAAMQENMRKLYGDPGKPRPRPDPGDKPIPPAPELPKEKPMWVNAHIFFAGKTWSDVAVRFKGNSSLMFSWWSGSHKLPFKIDFAKFADKKRKFYGFTELSLSNNFADSTLLREPLAYRLLGEMGLPASRTALYRLIVDYGSGAKDYGIYTAIEVTNDTVVADFFGEDKGNIYEGDGRGVTLEKNVTVEQIKTGFQKENNKKKEDWSDILGLHTLLHNPQRLSHPLVWRTEMERRFEVPNFLRWLALSAVLEHWDTYGGMTHNFYLYNQNGKLHWISWDHNLILGAGIGVRPSLAGLLPKPPPGKEPHLPSVTLDRAEITDKWPLIRFLLDDPIYGPEYRRQLRAVKDHYFRAAKIEADLRQRAKTIRLALPASELDSYEKSLDHLIKKIYEQEQKLNEYLIKVSE